MIKFLNFDINLSGFISAVKKLILVKLPISKSDRLIEQSDISILRYLLQHLAYFSQRQSDTDSNEVIAGQLKDSSTL